MDDRTVRFGAFELDLEGPDLAREGRPVDIAPLPLRVLTYLAEHPGDLVAREVLRREFWDERALGFDDRLNTCIAAIRTALDDDAHAPRYIATVRGRGYRFIGCFQAPDLTAAAAESPPPPTPPTARSMALTPRSLRPGRRRLAGAVLLATAFAWLALAPAIGRLGKGAPGDDDPFASVDPEARELYVRASHYMDRSQIPSELQESVRLLREAVDIEPEFALAHARLGLAASRLSWMYGIADMRAQAVAAASRAVALAPELPEALIALGHVRYTERRFDEALELYRGAERLRPDDPEILANIGLLHRRTGDWSEAGAYLERAFALDSTSVMLASALASTMEFMRRWSAADRYYRLALSLEPQVAENHVHRAVLALKATGDARAAMERLMDGARAPADSADRLGLIPISPVLTRVLGPRVADAALAGIPRGWRDHPSIRNNVAWLRAAVGDSAGASETWRSIIDVLEPHRVDDSFDGRSWPSVHLNRARALVGIGRNANALHELDALLYRLRPATDARAWGVLGPEIAAVLVEAGELQPAVSLIRDLVNRPTILSRSLLHIDPVWEPVLNELPPSDFADASGREQTADRQEALMLQGAMARDPVRRLASYLDRVNDHDIEGALSHLSDDFRLEFAGGARSGRASWPRRWAGTVGPGGP